MEKPPDYVPHTRVFFLKSETNTAPNEDLINLNVSRSLLTKGKRGEREETTGDRCLLSYYTYRHIAQRTGANWKRLLKTHLLLHCSTKTLNISKAAKSTHVEEDLTERRLSFEHTDP